MIVLARTLVLLIVPVAVVAVVKVLADKMAVQVLVSGVVLKVAIQG